MELSDHVQEIKVEEQVSVHDKVSCREHSFDQFFERYTILQNALRY